MLNKIYNENCLEGMKRIPDKSIDMILCDLPYGTTRNKWDSIIPLDQMWKQYNRIIKDNGAIILTAQTPFDKVLGASNLKLLRYEWIWKKSNGTGHLNAKKMPLKNHENILVFYKKLPIYNPQFTEGTPYKSISKKARNSSNYGKQRDGITTINGGYRYPLSVQKFNYDKEKLHPTQKPVALFEYLIKTYTNEGETVLDNCMGSGTTAIACMNTNRNFIGFELDEDYWRLANERIEQHKAIKHP
ncbi:site-specific DNA-methyltransferase [Bacillus mobilis]|uniref:DNA-methyltransferase n=1 Tax=Bacillus mobilis TaxID=2026190 RepID=UPI002E1C6006|nr:site-specific DNA-methyltransferase [Bacillus mobilis]MED0957862.1 site-specific DNA-methyltransferase [Bacillus mobilis]